MQFSEFLLNRLCFLERTTRGYGNCISERALFQSLTEQGLSTDEFFVIVQWGILQGLLNEHDTDSGRRFIVDRQALSDLRARANGETDRPAASDQSDASENRHPQPDSDNDSV